MSTAVQEQKQQGATNNMKEVPLSDKATKWCRKVARVAGKRAFRVKAWQEMSEKFDPEKLKFFFLPKIYHRKRVSHTDGKTKVYLHPEFFDDKGNIVKGLPKDKRTELKAAVFKEVAHLAVKRPNTEFYKIMVRCPWTGPRVDGAPGSQNEARKVLEEKKKARQARRQPVKEVPTGRTEDVEMYDLRAGKKVLVKNAEIFLTEGTNIKIARGQYEGRKLRTMLPGGSELAKELNLN